MARRKVSPEMQIIALFTGLSDEGKRMAMFGLNAIMSNESPKSPAPVAAKKSSRKGAGTGSTANTEGEAGNATDAGPKCIAKVPGLDVVCGDPEGSSIHVASAGYGGYHEFEAPKTTRLLRKSAGSGD